ncbi:MAG: alpha/beta hydrolase [Clostridia bacterium]|nr:alpha/beta hydrolase [Clostridia bacterium]
MQTTIDGRQVSYMDQGEGDVILLLHGWGAQASTYRLIIDHLSARFRVVAPDLPGFGGSDEPPTAWNVDEYVAFVDAFVAALGLTEAAVIGHSNGGRILIKFLARPDCPLTVRKAILMDAAGIPARHGMGWHIRVYSYKALKKILNLKIVKKCFPNAVTRAQSRFGSEDYKNASPLMRQVMVKMLAEDVRPCLPNITASTLLIWGENDTATPLSDGRQMEAAIPDAGLVVFSGAGHFAFAERWGQCRAVLDSFLPSGEPNGGIS